jgi:hypothetical protein
VKLTNDDVVKVLQATQRASVGMDRNDHSLVRTGGPAEIQNLVAPLGTQSQETTFTKYR